MLQASCNRVDMNKLLSVNSRLNTCLFTALWPTSPQQMRLSAPLSKVCYAFSLMYRGKIMIHIVSKADLEFRHRVESCKFPVSEFDHRAHIRLAYVYLAENSVETSVQLMREALFKLLKHAGVDPSQKYHETLTEAWVLAVRHFMNNMDSSESADEFIAQNSVMLDSKIMLTHYSAEVLFSERARQSFVEPNLDPIPGHGG
jgi:hypothetical protein